MLGLVLRRAREQRRLLTAVIALVATASTLVGVCALLLGVTWLWRRRGEDVRPALWATIGIVFVGSLALGIHLTEQQPAAAYFSTFGRAWELALGGVLAMFVPPFLLPMLIQADPTRRAALQSAGAQLLAGALGPLTAAWAVGAGGMRLMLEVSAGLILAGFAVFCALRFTTAREVNATV